MTPDQSKNIAAYLATKVRKGKGKGKSMKPNMKMRMRGGEDSPADMKRDRGRKEMPIEAMEYSKRK